LLKKEEKSKKKFEIRIQGSDWGIEEFQGTVEDDYFKLKRYRYFGKDNKFFVYSGRVKPLNNGCLVQCLFRFDVPTSIFLAIFFTAAVMKVITGIESKNIKSGSFDLAIYFLLIYTLFIAGFNYRTKKVKELIEKKLWKR
jgi:hypothetical protein